MYFLGAQDLTALANNLYSVYTCNPDLAGGSLKEQLETLSREEFAQQLVQTHKERWSSGEAQKDFLYAGSSQRASLSDTEIAALVNKYDPHSMSQKEYSSFLDDLVDMGAISQYEKRLMGYNGMVSLGYFDADGAFVGSSWDAQILPGNQADVRSPAEAGDILGWLRDMLSRQNVVMGGMDQEAKEQNRERYEAVSGILERMEALQKPQSGEDGKKAGLVRQLADPDSGFYADILETLRLKMEEREDQEREQAIIDALGLVLDTMSGKRDTHRSDITLSTAEIAQRISELDPQDPERVRLELFLQRLNELGIYFDPADLTGGREEDSFETLSQLLLRRQREQISSSETP